MQDLVSVEQWHDSLERTATELLERGNCWTPPVD